MTRTLESLTALERASYRLARWVIRLRTIGHLAGIRSTPHSHSKNQQPHPKHSTPPMAATPSTSNPPNASSKPLPCPSDPLGTLVDPQKCAPESPRSASRITSGRIGSTPRCHRRRFEVHRINSKAPSKALRGASDVLGRTNAGGESVSNAVEVSMARGSRFFGVVGFGCFAFCRGVGFGSIGFEQIEIAKDLRFEVVWQRGIGLLFGFQTFTQSIEQANGVRS